MKALLLVLALFLTSTVHAEQVPVNDLRVILNDLNSWLSDTKMSILESIEPGPVAACGNNAPAYYTVSFRQNWNSPVCKVVIGVVPSDGRCQGNAPRVARLGNNLPACFDNKYDSAK